MIWNNKEETETTCSTVQQWISRKYFAQQRFERGFLNVHTEECNDLYSSPSITEKGGKNY